MWTVCQCNQQMKCKISSIFNIHHQDVKTKPPMMINTSSKRQMNQLIHCCLCLVKEKEE